MNKIILFICVLLIFIVPCSAANVTVNYHMYGYTVNENHNGHGESHQIGWEEDEWIPHEEGLYSPIDNKTQGDNITIQLPDQVQEVHKQSSSWLWIVFCIMLIGVFCIWHGRRKSN